MNAGPVSVDQLEDLLDDVLETSGLKLTYTVTPQRGQSGGGVAVEFGGEDSAMLVARNAELLLALEHVTAKALRLAPEQHDLLHFESNGYKAKREHNLKQSADQAIAEVRRTGKAFAFPPMSSHERRMLHLLLAPTGMRTESEGDGPLRHLVLHPR
jgi:spoIIIJ-associated protein